MSHNIDETIYLTLNSSKHEALRGILNNLPVPNLALSLNVLISKCINLFMYLFAKKKITKKNSSLVR